jgi:hypothetical protein
MTMNEQPDLFGSLSTPAAPPTEKQDARYQSPTAPPSADAELDRALETLTQYSIERIIRRVMSLDAAELLDRLRLMPAELISTELKEHKQQVAELQQKGCIAVTRKRKRVSVWLQRQRIIELAQETDERLQVWAKGEFARQQS